MKAPVKAIIAIVGVLLVLSLVLPAIRQTKDMQAENKALKAQLAAKAAAQPAK